MPYGVELGDIDVDDFLTLPSTSRGIKYIPIVSCFLTHPVVIHPRQCSPSCTHPVSAQLMAYTPLPFTPMAPLEAFRACSLTIQKMPTDRYDRTAFGLLANPVDLIPGLHRATEHSFQKIRSLPSSSTRQGPWSPRLADSTVLCDIWVQVGEAEAVRTDVMQSSSKRVGHW